jgi:hypothetical protein
MNVNDLYSNEFIKVEDLKGKTTKPLTIMSAIPEDLGNRTKLVLTFVETEKKLPLNKTNTMYLSDELGEESDDWKGAKVRIGPDKTIFQGKRVPCIRIIEAVRPDSDSLHAAQSKEAENLSTEDIPF